MDDTLSVYLDIIAADVSGDLILQAADKTYLLDNGEAIAGRYSLSVVTGTVAAGAGTVKVTCESSTFYRHLDTFAGTLFDGLTSYTNIVPGVNIIFATGVTDTMTATIDVGDFLGLWDAGNPTGVPPGTYVYRRRIGWKNTGSTDLTGCYMIVNRPRAVLERKSGTTTDDGLEYIRVVTTGATEKEQPGTLATQPYAITFANLDTAATPDEIDVLVDGVAITTVRDMDQNTTGDSLQLKRDGTTRYRIESGGLTGIEFVIGSAAANTNTANIFVFNRRMVSIAADLAGSPGTFGTTDVQLTQTGRPAGEIAAGQAAYGWVQVDVPSGTSANKNPHPLDIYTQYRDTGAALWGT